MEERRNDRPLLVVLVALTTVTGCLDAVCYLGLGRVFTANMTGNVVILGFSAAGAPGFSIVRPLIALAGFALGTLSGGRLALVMAGRPRAQWVSGALTAESLLIAVAALVVAVTDGSGGHQGAIAVLATAMGIRNATVRRLAVPDMSTTVLTTILTGLIAESSPAGGTNPRAGRRVGAVVALAAGAAGGGWLVLHRGLVLPLLVAACTVAAIALAHALWVFLRRVQHS
ncbi:YoaK family protein [Peterkaempfera bronchialis]|uniref:YoaK family protein n=1 Tax=Peterkaempfera bronchialis TaxID=2126346 RepID=UPI003C2F4051